MDNLEILVTGGRVCEGSGGEPFPADVLVRDGKIARVGMAVLPPRPGTRIIRADNLIVAPGFIDLHSHADLLFPLPERERNALLSGRIRQGITTEIVGNCGLGPCPATERTSPIVQGVIAWMAPARGGRTWPTVGAYLDALETGGVPNNVGTLAAHGPVRVSTMGLRSGPPDESELAKMIAAVERALDEGAFGLSCGLIYPPGMFSDTEELVALARPVARAGRLLTSHVRGSSELLLESVDELLRIGRVAGCRVHHSHNEAVGRSHWWKIDKVLEREDAARVDGVRASFDMFPYSVAATMMLAIYPPWSLEGGLTALLARLGGAQERERIRRDIEGLIPSWPPWRAGGWPHNLVSAVGWSGIAVASVASSANRRFEGCMLSELAEAKGTTPFDAISDLMLEEEGKVGQWVFEISGDGADETCLQRLAAHPAGAFCTDAIDTGRGLPHPGAYGAFPRILARFVREQRLLQLGEAVRKMTSYPAQLLGLKDRGCVTEGAWADLVLFDPDEIEDLATLAEPRRVARGIPFVLVNGSVVVDDGRYVGGSAGRVLRA